VKTPVDININIYLDLDDHYISHEEVVDMARVLADAYPDNGRWVSSFGFLTYIISRRRDDVLVEVYEGYGYHGFHGFDVNVC